MSYKNGENLIQRVLTNPDKFKRNMEENVEQQMEGMQHLEDDILENPEDLIVYNPRCIRNRSNWTTGSNAYKFDRPSSFQPEALLQAMPLKSPKMEKLMSHIKELDEADKKRDGTYYKHFIFSDIKNGMYGAKLLASVFIASGYNLGYGRGRNKLELKSDETLAKTPYNNFYLLSSGAVYNSPISVAAKRTMLKKYNSRPDNSYGKEVRFIIMDSGFKEGIDLFDVKYVHIFEPQTTMADQKQVIGRATRTCGQKGLEFHPTQGWPLHVFNYDLHISPKYAPTFYDSKSAIELYLKTAGIDFRKLNFVSDLERASILASVDYELNHKIHNFSIDNDDNDDDNKSASVSALQKGGNETTQKLKLKRCSRGFRRNKRTGECKRKRCSNGTHRNPKTGQCESFIPKLRTRTRKIAKTQTQPLDNLASLSQTLSSLSSSFPSPPPPETITKIDPTSLSLSSDVSSLSKLHVPYYERFAPETPAMNFYELNQYVNDNFSDYAWDKIKMENLCVKKPAAAAATTRLTATAKKKKGGTKQKTDLITFTPTQDFVRHYFTPNNPVRGMLLWHSVGTGKTCSAIAAATSAFEPRGYTILWVTRTTLKNDIWKNMFEQVCHEQFRRKKVRQISDEHTERMRLLSSSWSIRPMSYKQFSNLVSQKNEIYKDLVKKNGAIDPLNKTLLIIDEAHKLYGGSDLSAIERPDMNALHTALMKSYMVSGSNSVKLLLMTATPITSDPMELIKLLNLCKLPTQQMPTSFDAFADEYLNAEEGAFTAKGEEKYLNDIAGHISYLNREKDARQFAQPRLKSVVVPLVSPKVERLINKVDKKYAKENINRDTLDLLIEQKNYEKQLEGDLDDLNAAKFAFLNKMACPDTFIMDATDKRKCNSIVKKHVKIIVDELKEQKAEIKDKLTHLKEKIKAIHAKYPAAAAANKTTNINKQDMEEYKDTTFYNFKYVCGEKVNTGPALVANLKNHPMMLEIDDSIAEMQSEVERMKEYVSLKKGTYEDRVKQLKEMIEKLEQRGIISKEERNGLLNEVENTQNQTQNKKEKEREKKEVKILRNAEKIIMKTRKQLITAKNKTMKNIESKYKKIIKENEKRKKREKKELLKEKREATDDRYIQGQTLKEKIRKSYEEIQKEVALMLEETKKRREEKERQNRAKTMKRVKKELVQTQKRKERVRKKADQDYKRQLRTYKRVLAETMKAQKKRTKRVKQK